ncbi:hypothetical protein ACTXI9_01670 [Brachybacterium alimentarium]|uniref:hypothetical protein n=1 Tax=Brachybacterium alimentarium TaxID=47845 RepID=UPI003FD210EF
MSTDPNLAELIQQHIDRTGETYTQISDRGKISRANVHRIATEDRQAMPRKATLDGLARGLSLPPNVIRRAALVTAGTSELDDPEAPRSAALERLTAATDNLSEDDLDLLRAIAQLLEDRRGR